MSYPPPYPTWSAQLPYYPAPYSTAPPPMPTVSSIPEYDQGTYQSSDPYQYPHISIYDYPPPPAPRAPSPSKVNSPHGSENSQSSRTSSGSMQSVDSGYGSARGSSNSTRSRDSAKPKDHARRPSYRREKRYIAGSGRDRESYVVPRYPSPSRKEDRRRYYDDPYYCRDDDEGYDYLRSARDPGRTRRLYDEGPHYRRESLSNRRDHRDTRDVERRAEDFVACEELSRLRQREEASRRLYSDTSVDIYLSNDKEDHDRRKRGEDRRRREEAEREREQKEMERERQKVEAERERREQEDERERRKKEEERERQRREDEQRRKKEEEQCRKREDQSRTTMSEAIQLGRRSQRSSDSHRSSHRSDRRRPIVVQVNLGDQSSPSPSKPQGPSRDNVVEGTARKSETVSSPSTTGSVSPSLPPGKSDGDANDTTKEIGIDQAQHMGLESPRPGSESPSCSSSFSSQSAPSDPGRSLESKLDELSELAARLACDESDVDPDQSTWDDNDSIKAGPASDQAPQDVTSKVSAWKQGVTNCQAGGSGSSNGSAQQTSPSSSSNSHRSTPSSSSKRTFDSRDGDENFNNSDDESRKKTPRRDQCPQDGESAETRKIQIPCFIDNCQGKDAHVSELIRKAEKHHSFFVCKRCYHAFTDENEFKQHNLSGYNCQPHCISSECAPITPVQFGAMPPGRRHRRRNECPSEKTVSARDRWQYLYHLRYPDRSISDSDPILRPGTSHPHGNGQLRPHRRQRRQPSDVRAFQRQVSDVRTEVQSLRQQQRHEAEMHEVTSRQQADKISRLEIVVAECMDYMMSQPGGMPGFLQRMIARDAPGAMKVSQQHNVSMTGQAQVPMPPPTPQSATRQSHFGNISPNSSGSSNQGQDSAQMEDFFSDNTARMYNDAPQMDPDMLFNMGAAMGGGRGGDDFLIDPPMYPRDPNYDI